MTLLQLHRYCPTCRVAWHGDPWCWSCGQCRPAAAERVAIPNAAGPNDRSVGTPLNL